MKLKRLIEVVMVSLVVAMAAVMNVKGGATLVNGLKPGTVASMTNPPGISPHANRPYLLKDLAERFVARERSSAAGMILSW